MKCGLFWLQSTLGFIENKVRDKRLATIFKINLSKEDMLNDIRCNCEQQRRNGTNSNSSGKASDWGTDKLRSDNNGKCRTERTVREIRSRFDEISNIDKRYNVSERAKELSVQQRDAEKLTGKNEPVRDEQSDNKQDNTSREKVTGEMENLVKRQIERYEEVLCQINYAVQKYTDKVTRDIETAQTSNRKYWFQRQQINYAIWGYLILSPVLVIFEMLSRYFHWF